MKLLTTLLVGTAGGLLFRRWKVPGGMLVGALAASAVLNVLFAASVVPGTMRTMAQIVAGAFSGSIITRKEVRKIPKVIRPLIWVLGTFLILNLGVGTFLSRITGMDLITSYLAMIPGSAMNTPIIAADYGADVTTVAVLQIVRLFFGIGVFPSMILWYGRKKGEVVQLDQQGSGKKKQTQNTVHPRHHILITAVTAGVFGWLGIRLSVPGGALIFSTLGSVLLNLTFACAYLPGWMKRAAQVVCGCYIGSHIGREDLVLLMDLILPAVVIVLVYTLNCFLMGNLLKRRFGYSVRKAMLMTTPAGAADMLLISADVGVEDSDLVIVHMIRMIFAVAVYPPVIWWVARLWG